MAIIVIFQAWQLTVDCCKSIIMASHDAIHGQIHWDRSHLRYQQPSSTSAFHFQFWRERLHSFICVFSCLQNYVNYLLSHLRNHQFCKLQCCQHMYFTFITGRNIFTSFISCISFWIQEYIDINNCSRRPRVGFYFKIAFNVLILLYVHSLVYKTI